MGRRDHANCRRCGERFCYIRNGVKPKFRCRKCRVLKAYHRRGEHAAYMRRYRAEKRRRAIRISAKVIREGNYGQAHAQASQGEAAAIASVPAPAEPPPGEAAATPFRSG